MQPLGGLAERGDHDHRDMQGGGIVLQFPAALEPVHARHHDIEQDQVGLPFVRHAQRLEPILGAGHLVVLGRELGFQQARVGRHIIDDQDPGGHRLSIGLWMQCGATSACGT